MNPNFEFAARSLLIGAGATLAIDSWAAILRRFGIPSLRIEHLGRWIGHLPRGRWRHEDIARTAPVRAEALLGWGAPRSWPRAADHSRRTEHDETDEG